MTGKNKSRLLCVVISADKHQHRLGHQLHRAISAGHSRVFQTLLCVRSSKPKTMCSGAPARIQWRTTEMAIWQRPRPPLQEKTLAMCLAPVFQVVTFETFQRQHANRLLQDLQASSRSFPAPPPWRSAAKQYGALLALPHDAVEQMRNVWQNH